MASGKTPLFYVDQIKMAISCRQLLEYNNIHVNRHGFAVCPCHGDTDASLKVYEGIRGWYCFGCHKGGDVINLAVELYGISFSDALYRLNTDFCLGFNLTGEPAREELIKFNIRQQERKTQREKEERERAEAERRYLDWTELYLMLSRLILNNEPADRDSDWNPVFCSLLRMREMVKERALEAQWRWFDDRT